MQTFWENRFSQRAKRMTSSAIRELLKLTEQPDVISFAGGLPAPEIFPVNEIEEACRHVFKEHSSMALQYSTTEGYLPLREYLASYTSCPHFELEPDNILITSGSQQALDLIGKVFIDPGDPVLVESPTYLGALQAWNAYDAKYMTVPMDDEGLVVDALPERLRKKPKFIYVLPNFQNPTGVTFSLERRHKLIELAHQHGTPIIEDDPYCQLRFEGEDIPSLLSLDDQFHEVYLSTFSKILTPGWRLAWIAAPRDVIHKLVQAKQGADLHTATFNQVVAYEVIKDGFLDEHIPVIRKVYHERRDVMLETMKKTFPANVHWTHPQGGLFLWVTLPEGVNAEEILKLAVEQKVAFVPGSSFHPDGTGKNTMRLNFSAPTPEQIELGITRLGRVLSHTLK